MAWSKLLVLHKFIKFIKTRKGLSENLIRAVDVSKRGPLHFLPPGFKTRVLAHPIWRKSERSLNAILQFINFPQDGKAKQQTSTNSFLKSLLPQVLKENRKLKNIWLRNICDEGIPKLSRGFKGSPGGEVIAEPVKRGRRRKGESERVKQKEEMQQAIKCLSGKGDAGQKQCPTFLMDATGKKREAENKDMGLPPPRRCRLSCPLPPPEFTPAETNQFLPCHQASSVRFASLPREFEPEKNENQVAFTFKRRERLAGAPRLKTQKTAKLLPYPVGSTKSHFYPPRPDILPQMKALLFDPEDLALNLCVVNAPTHIYRDEVLVQVTYSGVCGTDLFITEGKVSCGEGPVILGHEVSGRVFASGRDVFHVKPGDKVAIDPYSSCSICRYCTRGQLSSCIGDGTNHSLGISKSGGWAEYMVVNKAQVHVIPPQLGLDQAALIQPLSCILSALSKLNISPEKDIIIHGLGLAGCLWASVLHGRGHRNVYVSEKSEKKKQQFRQLHLGYSIIPPEDIGRFSADIVIECSGSPSIIERSLQILNPNGQMCFFGKSNPSTEIRCLPYEIIGKEITIVGTSGNAFCFSKAIDLASTLGQRYLDFEKLGIRVFDLGDFRDAFRLNKNDEVGKVMFKFES